MKKVKVARCYLSVLLLLPTSVRMSIGLHMFLVSIAYLPAAGHGAGAGRAR